jgi:hypothetical protein
MQGAGSKQEKAPMSSTDFAWLTEHSMEIYEKYAGKRTAVLKGDVAGFGDAAAADQAKAKHPSADHTLEAVDRQPDCV